MKRTPNARLILGCTVVGAAILAGRELNARGPGRSMDMGARYASAFSGSMNMGAGSASRVSGSPSSMGASNGSGFSGGGGAAFGSANAGRAWSDTGNGNQFALPPTNRGLSQQQANETRVLDQRLDQADHLRTISEQNGNSNLLGTANRMEAQANEHYDERMARIGSAATNQGSNVTATAPGNPSQVNPYSHLPTSNNQIDVHSNEHARQRMGPSGPVAAQQGLHTASTARANRSQTNAESTATMKAASRANRRHWSWWPFHSAR